MAAELIASGGHVIYLYGITSHVRRISPPRLELMGALGSKLSNVTDCVWISKVSRQEFEENLARNMEDLDWLTPGERCPSGAISAVARGWSSSRLNSHFSYQDSLFSHVQRNLHMLNVICTKRSAGR